MTGADILRALGGIDFRLVMLGAPTETQIPKARASMPIGRKLAMIAAVIALLICAVPLIQLALYSGDAVMYSYHEVIGRSDAAVFAKFKSKTEHLTGTDYVFEVTETLRGDLPEKQEITVCSAKKTLFSEDEMTKYENKENVSFEEDVEYFLTLSVDKHGEISFFGEQIIAVGGLADARTEVDGFIALLEEYGITVDMSRDELVQFFKYIFEDIVIEDECPHKVDEWMINNYPSDTKPGERTGVCSICGNRVTEQMESSWDLDYNLDFTAKTGSVTGIGDCKDKEIFIPTHYQGCTITQIDSSAFRDCIIENVIIPDTVTVIGMDAFANPNIKSVYIPDSVTKIYPKAFGNGKGAGIKIHIDKDNPYYIFKDNCLINKQTKILVCGFSDSVIPDDGSVEHIGSLAFELCSELKNIQIPSSVKTISSSAFRYCTGLEEIILPEGLTVIGESAFAHSGIQEIIIPEGLTSLEAGAFKHCESLKTAVIPSTFKEIPESMFYGCGKLETVNIPEGVETIGEGAFSHCYSLRNIKLPQTLTTIKNGAFYYSGIIEIIIPSSVTELEPAFERCYNLKTVVLPEGITRISNMAFSHCSKLKNITMPSTVTEIGQCAFQYCSELSTIKIPKSVTKIEIMAFLECSELTRIEYDGTIAEWYAITKEDYSLLSWDRNTGDYTVICTNGTVSKQ